MSTIANELLTLNNTKLAIKEAIINKGVDVGEEDTFASYADKIEEIECGGTEIDISKVSYQIGSGYIGEYKGRILKGFADMSTKCAFPVIDINNTDMGVPWNDTFEIGIGFKFIAFPTYQGLFGDGNYNSYRRGARIYYSNSDNDFWLCVSGDGSTLMVDAALGFTPQLDTWYFIKLRFVKSTMKLTVDITEDFKTYTNLYDNTLSTPPYYDSSAYLAIGGEARASEMASNTFLIDTFNTYVKDSSDELVWGVYTGEFDNGKYTAISKDYDLVEYIESDGTQVIDTGRQVIQGQTLEVTFEGSNNQTAYAWVLGGITSNDWYGFQFPPSSAIYWYNGGTSISRQEGFNANTITKKEITFNSSISKTIHVLGLLDDATSTYTNKGIFKIYLLNINKDYFLPVKRKSDGVYGLYDVTNQTFLTDIAGGNPLTGGQAICIFDEATAPTEEIIFNAENIQICTSQGYYLPQQPFDVNITEAGQYIISLHRISDDQVWTSIITYDGISDTTFSISYENNFTLHITPTSIGCQYYAGSWYDIYIKVSKALNSQIYIT